MASHTEALGRAAGNEQLAQQVAEDYTKAELNSREMIIDRIYGDIPEKVADILQRVDDNGKHLLQLINDVLDLSKIESGRLTLRLDDYSMDDLWRLLPDFTNFDENEFWRNGQRKFVIPKLWPLIPPDLMEEYMKHGMQQKRGTLKQTFP